MKLVGLTAYGLKTRIKRQRYRDKIRKREITRSIFIYIVGDISDY